MSSHSLPIDFAGSNPHWQEIEDLLDQLAELARSPGDARDFYRLLLDRIVPAIGASGGAVWTAERPAELRLEYQINLAGRSSRWSRARWSAIGGWSKTCFRAANRARCRHVPAKRRQTPRPIPATAGSCAIRSASAPRLPA